MLWSDVQVVHTEIRKGRQEITDEALIPNTVFKPCRPTQLRFSLPNKVQLDDDIVIEMQVKGNFNLNMT